ncbi:MAG: Flp pilus assembly complex ATPase component TadA, partial [Bacteroidaceae bacterium]|nr:Flp pilus assembly complex ATPase component TadA [Bacteroidaceae bacterium]
MVGAFHDVQVVLDDQYGVATLYQGIETLHQAADIVEVQTRGGFVEDEQQGRDFETISVAITAAETGHLVLSTLHTIGAASTVDRVIDVFPP